MARKYEKGKPLPALERACERCGQRPVRQRRRLCKECIAELRAAEVPQANREHLQLLSQVYGRRLFG